jgi:histidinol-phosphatase (PHP family)
LCQHASGKLEAYAHEALKRGIREIGFADHNPMPEWYDPESRMTIDQFPEYLRAVSEVQEQYEGRLTIRLGIEADYHPGTEAFVRDLVKRADFDYVIGSIHFLGAWGFDNPKVVDGFKKRSVDEIYAEYYGLVEQLAQSGLYDILGHVDLVKKFGHRPRNDEMPAVRRALEAVREQGMCIEINTAGLRKPCREIYPSARILTVASQMGIAATLGSDAHQPEHVGEGFKEAIRLLQECGYREVLGFQGRSRSRISIR